jgi:hypothetical protein
MTVKEFISIQTKKKARQTQRARDLIAYQQWLDENVSQPYFGDNKDNIKRYLTSLED